MTNTSEWREVKFQPHWTQEQRDSHIAGLKREGWEVEEVETTVTLKEVSEGKGYWT
tara:strand:- start:88 stop:255 length:168 start_codon:yes stop_codon:yes gene_type:complete